MIRGDALTRHFTVDEVLVGSELNAVPADVQPAVRFAADRLEDVRALLGRVPISPTSWYRTPSHNIRIGGSDSSDHPTGYAIDFAAAGLTPHEVVARLRSSVPALGIDQIIEYPRHVHVSFSPRRRGQVLASYLGAYVPWSQSLDVSQPAVTMTNPNTSSSQKPNPEPPKGSLAYWLLAIAGTLTAIGTLLANAGK